MAERATASRRVSVVVCGVEVPAGVLKDVVLMVSLVVWPGSVSWDASVGKVRISAAAGTCRDMPKAALVWSWLVCVLVLEGGGCRVFLEWNNGAYHSRQWQMLKLTGAAFTT